MMRFGSRWANGDLPVNCNDVFDFLANVVEAFDDSASRGMVKHLQSGSENMVWENKTPRFPIGLFRLLRILVRRN